MNRLKWSLRIFKKSYIETNTNTSIKANINKNYYVSDIRSSSDVSHKIDNIRPIFNDIIKSEKISSVSGTVFNKSISPSKPKDKVIIQDIFLSNSSQDKLLNSSKAKDIKIDKLSSDFKVLFSNSNANINQARKNIARTHPLIILSYIVLGIIPSIAIITSTLYGPNRLNVIMAIGFLIINYIIYLLLPKNYISIWIASIINSLLINSYLIWWLNTNLSQHKTAQILSIMALAFLNIFLYIRNYNIGLVAISISISIIVATMLSSGIIGVDFIYPLLILHIIIISILKHYSQHSPIFLDLHRIVLILLSLALLVFITPSTKSIIISLSLILLQGIYLYITSNSIYNKSIYMAYSSVLLLGLSVMMSHILTAPIIYTATAVIALIGLCYHFIKYLSQDDDWSHGWIKYIITILIIIVDFAPLLLRDNKYLALSLIVAIACLHLIFYLIFNTTINWVSLLLILLLYPMIMYTSILKILSFGTSITIYYAFNSLLLLMLTIYYQKIQEQRSITILAINASVLISLITGYYSGPLAMAISSTVMAIVLAVLSIKLSWPHLMYVVVLSSNLAFISIATYYSWHNTQQVWGILGLNSVFYIISLIRTKSFAVPIGLSTTLFTPLMVLFAAQSSGLNNLYIIFWGLALIILLTITINAFDLYYNTLLIIMYTGIGAYIFFNHNINVLIAVIISMAILLLISKKHKTYTIFDFRKKIV